MAILKGKWNSLSKDHIFTISLKMKIERCGNKTNATVFYMIGREQSMFLSIFPNISRAHMIDREQSMFLSIFPNLSRALFFSTLTITSKLNSSYHIPGTISGLCLSTYLTLTTSFWRLCYFHHNVDEVTNKQILPTLPQLLRSILKIWTWAVRLQSLNHWLWCSNE